MQKLINFDYVRKESIKEHNSNRPNTQIIRMIFIKILKNVIQITNEKY